MEPHGEESRQLGVLGISWDGIFGNVVLTKLEIRISRRQRGGLYPDDPSGVPEVPDISVTLVLSPIFS